MLLSRLSKFNDYAKLLKCILKELDKPINHFEFLLKEINKMVNSLKQVEYFFLVGLLFLLFFFIISDIIIVFK